MENIKNWASSFADKKDGEAFDKVLTPIETRLKSASLGSAGLQIIAGTKPKAENATEWYGIASGILVTLAADTAMPALVGTVAHDAFNVFVFAIDSASTVTPYMGTAGASLATIKFPVIPDGDCIIGMIKINPTGTGDFVGGTTDLDDATKVPNADYINSIGALVLTTP